MPKESRIGRHMAANYCMLAAICGLDLLTPLGIADGMLYSFVLVYHAYFGSDDRAFFLAGLSTALVIAGFFGSAVGLDSISPLVNRAFSITLVWSIATITSARSVVEGVHLPQLRHDVKGPVERIRRYAELMLEGGCGACHDQRQRDYLRGIQVAAQDLGHRLDALIGLVGSRVPAFARAIMAQKWG